MTQEQLIEAVRECLKNKGVETPMISYGIEGEEAKKNIIENHFIGIMKTLGLNLVDDSLERTPRRVAKMFVEEIFYGLNYKNFPKITTVENKMRYDNMVLVDKINVQSHCEHHFVNIDGLARIAYIPEDKVLGLSKFNRIVDFFSRRPQIQERLTEQIFYSLMVILGTDNVAVKITANHFCVKSRGIQDVNSNTTTTKLGGVFLTEDSARNEFLSKQDEV